MAVITAPDKNLTLTDADEIKNYLAAINIDCERWENVKNISSDASEAEILEAYAEEIKRLKKSGGYQTADVIDITVATPNLEIMLERFRPEHWHDEKTKCVLSSKAVAFFTSHRKTAMLRR